MEIRVPSDVERWPEFRLLGTAIGSSVRASFVFLRLWVDLAHLCGVTRRVGWLPATSVDLFKADLGSNGPVDFNALVGEREGEFKFLFPEIEGGEVRGYRCPRFAHSNGHLNPDHKPMHMKGAEASRFARRQKREQQEGTGQALLLNSELFVTPEGVAMDPESVRRINLLVRSVDNALGRPGREPHSFSEGLVQDAFQVVGAWRDRDLEDTCRKLLEFRDHPALPKTTEQILPRWSEIARNITLGDLT